MKMTKILAISTFGILLSACNSNQMQVEGSAKAMDSKGAPHTHSVENHGNVEHSHAGNSTASHGHSWNEMKKYLNQ